MKPRLKVAAVVCGCLLLAACQTSQSTPQVSLFPEGELTPFATQTVTATATVTPIGIATETPVPVPTSTPMTYTVKANETLFSIAANHGLTTDQLKAANPSVNPYLVAPGMVLIIPAADGAAEAPATTSQNVSGATPYPLVSGDAKCTPSISGGQYCFAELTNAQELMAGNISAEFHLTNMQTGEVLTQTALVPLNRILSGGSLPIFAYFSPPAFEHPQVSLKLLTAVSIDGSSSPVQSAVVKVDEPAVVISANGLSVVVSGQARFEAAEGTSGKVWIAAVAYDAAGNIVGIRRFSSGAAYSVGELVPFTLNVYSIGGTIDRVELFGEVNS